MKPIRWLPYLATGALLLASCNKTRVYPTSSLDGYLPLSVGKFIEYRMDSLVFVNSGQDIEVHSYLAKDTVDDTLYDNLGRLTYRVHRFLTDTLMANPWQDDITYTITPTGNIVELVENNLRFVPLTEPVTTDMTWLGNAYLGDDPYQTFYGTLTSQSSLQYWQFNYANIGRPYQVGDSLLQNTLTVQEANDSTNLPLPNDSVFANKSYGLEVYAAGIGLIYKSYILWDFQPVTTDLPGYYEGFGVTQYMVAHN